MTPTILYPFSIWSNNKSSYLQTLNLAKDKEAKVICFTSVLKEQTLDKAYLHLLDLYGYYQTKVQLWEAINIDIEHKIELGLLEEKLGQYLKTQKVDILISQPSTLELAPTVLDQLLLNSDFNPEIVNFG